MIIDFHTKLAAPRGDLTLGGDPEHAGVQYRPANEVDRKQTIYFFPKEKANSHKDRDYPWLGETYVLDGKKYSVMDINPPGNPKQTRFSAYRDYGRFGAFPVATIKKGQSLTLDYRFVIFDGDMLPAAAIQKLWDEYARYDAAQPRAGGKRGPGRTDQQGGDKVHAEATCQAQEEEQQGRQRLSAERLKAGLFTGRLQAILFF